MASWSTQAWHSVASSVLSVGNVRSCNHTAAVKTFSSLGEKVWMPLWLESYPEAWHLLSPSKSDVHSDWWTSPVWLENFLATKKGRSESMHCCLLSSCMSFFVVLYFVTSFIFCDLVFCGFFYCEFHGGQNICQHDVSRTRGLYVYSCSSRIAFQLSGFCLPFLKPFYAVPLSIGPKNKHVLFGTKMIALLLGSMVFCMVMQNMWICCVCWVWSKGSKNLTVKLNSYFNVLYVQPTLWSVHHKTDLHRQWTFCWNMITTTIPRSPAFFLCSIFPG